MIIKVKMLLDVIDDHTSMAEVINELLIQVFKDNSHIAKIIICESEKLIEDDSYKRRPDVEPR